jgi:hypothetical protein
MNKIDFDMYDVNKQQLSEKLRTAEEQKQDVRDRILDEINSEVSQSGSRETSQKDGRGLE